MSPRVSPIRACVVVSFALSAGVAAWAQTGTRSPFLPPQSAGGPTPSQGAPLEFRGYMVSSEGGTQYRIYDPAKKAGAWIKLNERNPDFDIVAKQHDDNHKTLTIEHQGRTLTLAERESKIVSGGAAMPAPPPPPAAAAPMPANVAPAVTQSVVLNPTPADEQRRLEAVAAEVARRRALREQASQQVGGQPPQGGQASQVPGMVPMTPAQNAQPAQPQRNAPQANPRQR